MLKEQEKLANPALHPGPLEPLMESICFFRSPEDLQSFLWELFAIMDTDDSGTLSFPEFRGGLERMNLNSPIKITPEDWQELTDDENRCNDAGELDWSNFEQLMHAELTQYIYKRMLSSMGRCQSPDLDMLIVLKCLFAGSITPGHSGIAVSGTRGGTSGSSGLCPFCGSKAGRMPLGNPGAKPDPKP